MLIFVNTICVLLYLVSAFYLLRRYREHLVFFGYWVFGQTWSLVSCYYNDLGVYNPELFRFTETTLATSRLAVFLVVFNLGFLVGGWLTGRRRMKRVDYSFCEEPLQLGHVKAAAYAVAAVVIAYIAYSFASGGIPVLSGVDRVTYREESGLFVLLLNWSCAVTGIVPFLLGYYQERWRLFSVNVLLMLLLIVYYGLTGSKFTGFIRILVPYLAPIFVRYYLSHQGTRLLRVKHAVYLGVAAAIFLGLAYGTYVIRWGDIHLGRIVLLNRVLALQGHLWWATDFYYLAGGVFDPGHWREELAAVWVFGDMPDGTYGMKYLMLKILGPDKAFPIFAGKYLYTMGYPAILIVTFPYAVAMGFQLAAGMLFFGMLYYLYHCIRSRHVIRAVLVLTVLMFYISMMQTGNFPMFVRLRTVVLLLLLAVAEFGVRGSWLRPVGQQRTGGPASRQ